MADYYEQFSEVMVIPEDKLDAVSDFLTAYDQKLESGELDIGGGVSIQLDGTELWLHADENFMDEELQYIAQGVLKVVDDPEDKPFVVSIAYTVSRPLVSEFGGRAVAFWKDHEYWVEARSTVEDYIKFHDGMPE